MTDQSILNLEPHFQRDECLVHWTGSDNTTGSVDPEAMVCGDFVNPGAFSLADWPFDQYQEVTWLYWKGDPGAQFKPTPEHPREFPFDNQNTLWNLDVVLANDNTTVMINLFSTSRRCKKLSSTTTGPGLGCANCQSSRYQFDNILDRRFALPRQLAVPNRASSLPRLVQVPNGRSHDVCLVARCPSGGDQRHLQNENENQEARV